MGDLEASEMSFLKSIINCTRRDQTRNNDIYQDLKILSITEHVSLYEDKLRDHLMRIEDERFPRQAMMYQPRDEKFEKTEDKMVKPE